LFSEAGGSNWISGYPGAVATWFRSVLVLFPLFTLFFSDILCDLFFSSSSTLFSLFYLQLEYTSLMTLFSGSPGNIFMYQFWSTYIMEFLYIFFPFISITPRDQT